MKRLLMFAMTAWLAIGSVACKQSGAGSGHQLTIGVSFETLQTEYWVAGFEAIKLS